MKKANVFKMLLLPFFVIVLFMAGCSTKIVTREANTNDVIIECPTEFSLNINYRITPQVNINNLKIKLSFYNSKNQLLKTKNHNVGNVTKGNQVTISISLTEFSLGEIFSISYTTAKVIGGTIPLF